MIVSGLPRSVLQNAWPVLSRISQVFLPCLTMPFSEHSAHNQPLLRAMLSLWSLASSSVAIDDTIHTYSRSLLCGRQAFAVIPHTS